MIRIDGIDYPVEVKSLDRSTEFLDRHAERTESGDLNRELLGVYYNYKLQLYPGNSQEAYDRLFDKLTEPVEFHEVSVPFSGGMYTFVAYFANVRDRLLLQHGGTNYWTDLTVDFIAKTPART